MGVLQIRKLADRSTERRVKRYDPITAEAILVNPANTDPDDLSEFSAGNWKHEPWPLAGIQLEGDAPKTCRVSTTFVLRGRREGWIEIEGETVVHRPGGPPDDLWRITHTFIHGTTLVLKCIDGDVRYSITRQPDKYVDTRGPQEDAKGALVDPPHPGKEDDEKVTDEIYEAGETRVDWFYNLKLES